MSDVVSEVVLVGVVGGGLFVAAKLGVLGSPKLPGPPNSNTPVIGAFTPAGTDKYGVPTPAGMFQTTPGDTVAGAICAAHGGIYDAGSGNCFGNDYGQESPVQISGGNW